VLTLLMGGVYGAALIVIVGGAIPREAVTGTQIGNIVLTVLRFQPRGHAKLCHSALLDPY
jgi:hypothetical protein